MTVNIREHQEWKDQILNFWLTEVWINKTAIDKNLVEGQSHEY